MLGSGRGEERRESRQEENVKRDRILEENRKERERRNVEWEEWMICFWNIEELERKDREKKESIGKKVE